MERNQHEQNREGNSLSFKNLVDKKAKPVRSPRTGFGAGTKFLIVFLVFGGVGFISWRFFTNASTFIGRNLQLAGVTGSGSGLIGHWTFDGKDLPNGQVNDVSGNGLNGSLQNFATTTGYAEGKIGQALYFNGANADITFPTGPFSGTGPFTVSAWIKTSLTTGTQVIAAQRDGVDINGEFLYEIVNGKMRYWDYNGGYGFADSAASESNSSVADGQWHHVAFIRNGTTGYHYIDGRLDATVTGASAINMSSARRFGIGADNRGALSFFKGNIDDVRMYSAGLTPNQIATLYHAGATTKIDATVQPPSVSDSNSGLVGHYTFDGKNLAQNAADSSAKGRNGYLNGFTTGTTTIRGAFGQALQFNGATTQYVQASGFSEIGTANQPYAISVWVKPATAAESANVIHVSASAVGTGWCLSMLQLSSGKAKALSWTGAPSTVTGSISLAPGEWYHIVHTWDASGGLRLYVNGVLDASTAQATFSASGQSNYVSIGSPVTGTSCSSNAGSIGFNGGLDDVRIYSRALSLDEIKELYQMGATTKVGTSIQVASSTPTNGNLTGYWTFDGKNMLTGQVNDSSGGGRNGSQRNMSTSTAYEKGRIGQALQFDGVDDAVVLPGTLANYFPTNAAVQSVSLWMKPTAAGPSAANVYDLDGVFMDQTVGDFGIMFGTTASFTGVWAYNYDGTPDKVGAVAPLNEWTHVVLVHSGGQLTLYTNGVSAGSTASGNLAGFSGVPALGKNYNASQFFKGSIDDVRTYDRALSPDEVKLLYSLGN